jgi:hypothetical protein
VRNITSVSSTTCPGLVDNKKIFRPKKGEEEIFLKDSRQLLVVAASKNTFP